MRSVGKWDGVLSMAVGESFNAGNLGFAVRANERNCSGR
jgi:hypothetical protein